MSDALITRTPEPMDRLRHDPKQVNPCPPLTAAEYAALKKSLEDGYLAGWPVVRSAGPACEGEIIDGFHRTEICSELGIEPVTYWQPVETETRFRILQIKANLERRNMTTTQRGILAVELKSLYEDEARAAQHEGRNQHTSLPLPVEEASLISKSDALAKEAMAKAARDAGVSRATAYQVQAIVEAAKESEEAAALLAAVKAGDKSIKKAYNEIRPKDEQATLDQSIKNEAQAEREIDETVRLMSDEDKEETAHSERQRAAGEAVRLAIQLDEHIRAHALLDQDVLEYRAMPHTFAGTARRLADWFDLTAEVLELNRRSK